MAEDNTGWCGLKCQAGISKITIRYDGSILPCESFKEVDAAILGNIHKGDSLEQGLKNAKTNKFLSALVSDFTNLRQNGLEESCPGQFYQETKEVMCYFCGKCGEESISEEELIFRLIKYQDSKIVRSYVKHIEEKFEEFKEGLK
ncbi:MAG: SPASM domain-containing protein [Nanoarchaeota archaeon]|nr:SPASM domain-containing protein [Nanoarchaeota archaeon]